MEPVVSIFFVLAIPAIVFLVPAWWRSKERMRLLDIVKLTAEQGQPLPEDVIRALPGAWTQPYSPRREIRRGAVLVALAVALLIIGFAVYLAVASANLSGAVMTGTIIAALGAIPGCMGVAMILLGRAERNQPEG